jgi:hypothetical protein
MGQAPNDKHQITNNVQIPNSNDQNRLNNIEGWNLFAIWALLFGL